MMEPVYGTILMSQILLMFMKALDEAEPNKVGIYDVGTGNGPLPFLLLHF